MTQKSVSHEDSLKRKVNGKISRFTNLSDKTQSNEKHRVTKSLARNKSATRSNKNALQAHNRITHKETLLIEKKLPIDSTKDQQQCSDIVHELNKLIDESRKQGVPGSTMKFISMEKHKQGKQNINSEHKENKNPLTSEKLRNNNMYEKDQKKKEIKKQQSNSTKENKSINNPKDETHNKKNPSADSKSEKIVKDKKIDAQIETADLLGLSSPKKKVLPTSPQNRRETLKQNEQRHSNRNSHGHTKRQIGTNKRNGRMSLNFYRKKNGDGLEHLVKLSNRFKIATFC